MASKSQPEHSLFKMTRQKGLPQDFISESEDVVDITIDKGKTQEQKPEPEPQPKFSKECISISAPWLTQAIVDTKCPWTRFHNEIAAFYKYYGPNNEQNKMTKRIFKKITEITEHRFKANTVVEMYGSR